ncbi:MAG: hypothetical protein ACX98W_20215, partial [bacterium]
AEHGAQGVAPATRPTPGGVADGSASRRRSSRGLPTLRHLRHWPLRRPVADPVVVWRPARIDAGLFVLTRRSSAPQNVYSICPCLAIA